MSESDMFNTDLEGAVSQQHKLLDSRPVSNEHSGFIKTAVKFNEDEQEYVDLIKKVFSHHDTQIFNHISSNALSIDNESDISRFFHHHKDYYLPPKIYQGLSSDNPHLNYEEFNGKIKSSKNINDQNDLIFLVGNIGIGKTTFLCNFVSRRYSAFLSKKLLPIKINLDIVTSHQIPSIPKILSDIKSAIMTGLLSSGVITAAQHERLTIDCRCPEDSDASVADANLNHTISTIRDQFGYSLFFIVDNIDYLYHLGDRGHFAPGGDENPERHQIKNAHGAIIDLIDVLWRNPGYTTSRQGMPILISCRRDTISYLMSKHHEVPIRGLEERIYSLAQPDLDRAKNVLEKRFDLMIELCKKIPEKAKREEFIRQSKSLQKSYAGRRGAGSALLDDLWALSRKGLRDMINQISEFSWLEYLDDKKANLNARFTQQYYPSMLAYMLAGHRRYTQFLGNVPNIYLINATVPSNELGVPSSFKSPHIYTLWLKRLILEYLQIRKGLNTNISNVVDTFCGRNRRAYSENLVRYVLSSLFEVPTSELIDLDIAADGGAGDQGYIQQVTITERGEFILNECADSIKYLQLVVDNWKILLPNDLHQVFEYRDPDYSYLVSEEGDYGRALNLILQNKMKQVFNFSLYLEEIKEHERKVWPKVFTRLEQAGVNVDSSDQMSQRVRREIFSIRDAMKMKAELDFLRSDNERSVRALMRSVLEDVYAPCEQFRLKHYGSW